MKVYICDNISVPQTSLCQKINISRLIIDLIVIQILWRTLNILETVESNQDK